MEVLRVFDLLENFREKYSYKDDILAGKDNGNWVKYNVEDYIEQSDLFSYGLLASGINKGDIIATITNNRPEWNFIDMGSAQAGVIHVPIYPTISKDDYYYIFKHCTPRLIIVSDKNTYDKIEPIAGMAGINEIYSINKIDGVSNWNEILQKGRENKESVLEELKKIKRSIKPDDLFTIIYTSGTTGFPKGVMLSHNNFINNFRYTAKVHFCGPESNALSFLPLSHIYERCLNYHYQNKGISIYYAESMGTIAENLSEIKPHIFCTVPRVLELFFEKIQGKGHALPLIRRIIFFWALELGKQFQYGFHHKWFFRLKLKIADKLVYHKVREALGGRINLIVTGGASIQVKLANFFWAAGIPVIEGYGLTETSPVIAVNDLAHNLVMIGTVGPVIEGVEVKIADDGEILCRGHNVMLGYYKENELTKTVINGEGWFHTGDIGTLVNNKFLKITDRKKEIFKLSSGKYIAPQVIENRLKEFEFIEQAMVIGENQKFASAIIQPNFSYLQTWSDDNKIPFNDNIELIQNSLVIEQFQKAINELNMQLGQHENIKRFRLIADEWSTLTGELSPTLKLKRKFIYEKYQDIIEQIFSLQKND
jgi:long-chain acyl-CoA synthetase